MQFRIVFCLCTAALLLVLMSSSIAAAQEGNFPRGRKLSNTHWLSAPHLPALTKRGRFVFRDAPNVHHHDSNEDDLEDSDLHAEKRNWRL